jgi:hypothetical protein
MGKQYSRIQNRYWILMNYFSILAVLILFYRGKFVHWSPPTIVIEIGFIVLLLYSFNRAFIKTRFWYMTHTSYKNLDEREMQVVLSGLQYSYSIFTVICLIIIYAFAITEFHPIDVVIAGALLYLAHTLPAAIVGWREKNSTTEKEGA